MRQATEHIREPWAALTGAIFFPIGFLGALNEKRWQVKYAATYMSVMAVVYFGIIFFDGVYTESCDAYPANVVIMTLTQKFPPAPITKGAVEMLKDLSTYSVDEVRTITGGFRVFPWYVFVAGLLAAALAYTGSEASKLVGDMDSGPLGLGVNYGLDRWSEVVNHDAIRRYKERQMDSKFISDAMAPLYCHPGPDPHPNLGYLAQPPKQYMGYGSFHPIDLLEDHLEPKPNPGDPDQILSKNSAEESHYEGLEQLRFLREADSFKQDFYQKIAADHAAFQEDTGYAWAHHPDNLEEASKPIVML